MSEAFTSVDLRKLTDELLAASAETTSGRKTHVFRAVTGGSLSQVLLALQGGKELAEHENPGEALLHVLRGRVRMTAGDKAWELGADEHIVIPPERHGLLALEDAAVLLTVVRSRT